MPIPYYHVDSFADQLFAGNPAGVCICPTFPAPEVMQAIAAENRHSETAFAVHRSDGDFDLKWFTPKVEDDLCGHATLATAYVLGLRQHPTWPVHFHTRSGVLTVTRDQDRFELDFPARPPHACDVPTDLLRALGLESAQVMRSSRDYLVVLEDAASVTKVTPDIFALAKLDIGIGGAIVTASGGSDPDYVCRFFAPAVGVDEDPATGSIQCTLAPYWAGRLGKQTVSVRQLSARGASMRCRVAGDRVYIGGTARLYLKGTIEL